MRRRVSDLISILADRDYLLPLDADDSTIPGDVEVVFKHNLERELIVAARPSPAGSRATTSPAAQWLETKTVQRSDEQLEFLAHLYERGGDRAARRALLPRRAAIARARATPPRRRASSTRRASRCSATRDAPARIDALHNLGDVLEQAGRTDEAMRAASSRCSTSRGATTTSRKAGAAYSRLARGQRRLGKYDSAMEHLRRAHELFERSRDDRGIASTLDDMGRVHWLRGAYGQALDFHRQALTIRRALGDRRSIALSLANIGRVHHDSGNFKAAINQFREALDLRRDIGDLVGVVQSLCDLGGVHAEDGNHELALELLGEARTIAQEIGDKLALADVLSRAGEVKARDGARRRGRQGSRPTPSSSRRASAIASRSRSRTSGSPRSSSRSATSRPPTSRRTPRVAVSEAVGLRVAHRLRLPREGRGRRGARPRASRPRTTSAARSTSSRRSRTRSSSRARTRGSRRSRSATGSAAEAQKLRGRADEIFTRLRGAAATE